LIKNSKRARTDIDGRMSPLVWKWTWTEDAGCNAARDHIPLARDLRREALPNQLGNACPAGANQQVPLS